MGKLPPRGWLHVRLRHIHVRIPRAALPLKVSPACLVRRLGTRAPFPSDAWYSGPIPIRRLGTRAPFLWVVKDWLLLDKVPRDIRRSRPINLPGYGLSKGILLGLVLGGLTEEIPFSLWLLERTLLLDNN